MFLLLLFITFVSLFTAIIIIIRLPIYYGRLLSAIKLDWLIDWLYHSVQCLLCDAWQITIEHWQTSSDCITVTFTVLSTCVVLMVETTAMQRDGASKNRREWSAVDQRCVTLRLMKETQRQLRTAWSAAAAVCFLPESQQLLCPYLGQWRSLSQYKVCYRRTVDWFWLPLYVHLL